MPDVLADGRFGEDHDVKCPECGAKTYLTDDQGGGLMGYNCENCGTALQVQYEFDDDDEGYEPEGWELAMSDDLGSQV